MKTLIAQFKNLARDSLFGLFLFAVIAVLTLVSTRGAQFIYAMF